MDEQNNFTSECPLCGSHHSVFDVSGCFSKSIENVLKSNPHHFDELFKRDSNFNS